MLSRELVQITINQLEHWKHNRSKNYLDVEPLQNALVVLRKVRDLMDEGFIKRCDNDTP
jgi:hypothetical protein